MARILRDAGADREGLMGARDWVWRGRYPFQSEEGPGEGGRFIRRKK